MPVPWTTASQPDILTSMHLTPDQVDALEAMLAGGATYAASVTKFSVARSSFYHWLRQQPPDIKARLSAAAEHGCQMQIDRAYTRAQKAKTRDQALIARIAMETAARRAELTSPKRFGKQQAQLQLPQGSSGAFVIAWQSSGSSVNVVAEQRPADSAIAPAAPAAEPIDVAFRTADDVETAKPLIDKTE